MKVLFFGDSITDMHRNRDTMGVFSYGNGYVFFATGDLKKADPNIEVVNRGISGNKVVDLYARVKDVWNHQPDVLSILIGVNDVWHEISSQNGVEIDRFEKMYRMLIEDTLKVLPKVKIMLLEPFILKGTATELNFDKFLTVKEYAKVVKKLSEEYGLFFVPLQEAFEKGAEKNGAEKYLYDGVHPDILGARLIADCWLEVYDERVKKSI